MGGVDFAYPWHIIRSEEDYETSVLALQWYKLPFSHPEDLLESSHTKQTPPAKKKIIFVS